MCQTDNTNPEHLLNDSSVITAFNCIETKYRR